MASECPASYFSLPLLTIIPSFLIFLLFPLYSISLFHVSFPCASASTIKQGQEALSLLTWKSSLDIQSQSFLSSWSGSNPCYHWFGVTCNNPAGTISHLNLSSCGLRGTLHNLDFSSLPDLLYLNLQKNSFYKTIPSNITYLSKLTFLSLSINALSGDIPYGIGMLRSLEELFLSYNVFVRLIPQSIGNLTKLMTLHLDTNNLSGPIPQEIGFLRSLNSLDLSINNLEGSIPPSIGNLRNLTSLYLYENNLSGSIPQEIGLLRSLNDLVLSINKLSGHIPSFIET